MGLRAQARPCTSRAAARGGRLREPFGSSRRTRRSRPADAWSARLWPARGRQRRPNAEELASNRSFVSVATSAREQLCTADLCLLSWAFANSASFSLSRRSALAVTSSFDLRATSAARSAERSARTPGRGRSGACLRSPRTWSSRRFLSRSPRRSWSLLRFAAVRVVSATIFDAVSGGEVLRSAFPEAGRDSARCRVDCACGGRMPGGPRSARARFACGASAGTCRRCERARANVRPPCSPTLKVVPMFS